MKSPSKLVGLVGLGLMGSALAERFLRSGFRIAGFDLEPKRRIGLKRLGGKPLNSAAEVAMTCERVVVSLPTTDVVKAVIREMGDKLHAGTSLIDTTTGEPEQTAALGALL